MYTTHGEKYETEEEFPDFGSISVVQFREQGECRYLFNNVDRDKLDLLVSAGDGSLAYCTDENYTLIKHNGVWLEV